MRALTRTPSGVLGECELTFVDRAPIDVERARRQHAAYNAALRACGVEVEVLPAAADLPDAVFGDEHTWAAHSQDLLLFYSGTKQTEKHFIKKMSQKYTVE